jgi:hypothetical protein
MSVVEGTHLRHSLLPESVTFINALEKMLAVSKTLKPAGNEGLLETPFSEDNLRDQG